MRRLKQWATVIIAITLLITGILGGVGKGRVNAAVAVTGTETLTGDSADDTTIQVAAQKQYGILAANSKGIYTLVDYSKTTNGKIETTEQGNVMIPLKKVASQFPDLKYAYDTKTKKISIRNLINKKKLVFTLGSSNYYYYKNTAAKGVVKKMPYSAYISKESKAVMVHMAVLKWIFDQTEGVKYYKVSDMQAKGYDTTSQSGIIVYNPSQKVMALPLASIVSNVGRTVRVTVPEGYSVPQIFALLVKKGVCASEDLLYTAMYEYDFTYYPLIAARDNNANRCYPLEGYLYPDTYEFNRLSKGQDAIGKFLRNGQIKITDADLQKAATLGYTMDQILTIASLIEKEAKDKETRYNISSVIYNRLKIQMKLQFDAGTIYVESYIKPYITGDINRYNSYYNTYKCPALPAGPICNPGREAINAALNPPQTDYLYFYSDEQKEYFFSHEPHNQ